MPVTLKYGLIAVIIAFCIYANTLQNGYALDDALAINTNVLVKKGVSAIPELLSTSYHAGNATLQDNLYRPLSLVMFAIEYQLFPGNAFLGHLINILLYSGCVMLFFLFLHRMLGAEKPEVALIGAILFAVHPIHTEVVANIKSRDELLCFFFCFLSLNAFLRYAISGAKLVLLAGSLFYLLSLLSKETSVTMVAIVPVIFFFSRSGNRKRSLHIFLLTLLPAAAYLFIRFSVLASHQVYDASGLSIYENALTVAPSFASGLATEILVLGHYIKLLVIPYPLISDYSYNAIPFVDFTNVWVWLSLISYILLAFLGIFGLLKKRNALLTVGILFFLFTISIFSNIAFLVGSEMAERFLFFPSAGMCMAVACAIGWLRLPKGSSGAEVLKSKHLSFVLIPVTLAFMVLTVMRNAEWKDDLTLFSADAKKSPANFRLYYLAGNAEMLRRTTATDPAEKQQMLKAAIADYQASLAIYPDFDKAHTNLALSFRIAGQLDSSEAHCKSAIRLNPAGANAIMTLANIYSQEKRYPEALTYLKQRSAASPGNATYYCDAGVCFVYMRQFDSAVGYFKKALSIDPANSQALKLTAFAYNFSGEKDSATKYETMARHYDPRFNVNNASLH